MNARARYFLAAWSCAVGLHTSAQPGALHGRVLEAGEERPLARAHVRDTLQGRATITDQEGRFSLPRDERRPSGLLITHLGFAPTRIAVPAGAQDAGIHVRLHREAIVIAPVEVTRQMPEVVCRRPRHHVGDYLVGAHGVWVLVYDQPRMLHRADRAGEQVFHGARLLLLDHGLSERGATGLPDAVRGIRTDHRGLAFVEGERHAWCATYNGAAISLERIGMDTLYDAVLPWRHRIGGVLLGSVDADPWPAIHHVALDTITGEQHTLCVAEDRRTVELHRSEYKYMRGADKVVAMDLGRELGLDPEVVAGFMTDFRRSLYYRAPYAPLFVVHDTVVVFDHGEGRVHRYDAMLSGAGGSELRHHRDKRFRELVQDAATGDVYAVFAQGPVTSLRSVRPSDGALGTTTLTLTHPFPEAVNVFDGHAYYLYREPGGNHRRALYRERLR